MDLCKIWVEQCEAARGIEDEFGTDKALAYLVGEKFLNFLEAAETHPDFRRKSRLRRQGKDDLRAVATGGVPGDGTADGAFDPGIYEDEDPEDIGPARTGRRTSDARPKTCCWSSGRGNGSLDPGIYEDEDPEDIEMYRQENIRRWAKTCSWSSRRRDGCWRTDDGE